MPLGQNLYKKALYWATLIWVELYLQFSVYMFFIPYYRLSRKCLWVYAFCLGAAACLYVLAGSRFIREKKRLTAANLRSVLPYEQLYLVLLFCWFIFTVVLSEYFWKQYYFPGYFLSGNSEKIINTGLIAFIFFPFARYAGREKAKSTIEGLLKTLIIPFAVFSGWVLWQYFHGNYVTFPSGHQLQMGNGSVLQTSYHSHNTLAGQSMIMCGLSLYMLATQKPAKKPIYIVSLFIFLVFLAATNSRNYWYCTALMICAFAFFSCWTGLSGRLHGRKTVISFCIGVCAAFAAALVLHEFRKEVFSVLYAALARVPEPALSSAAAAKSHASVYAQPLSRSAQTAAVQTAAGAEAAVGDSVRSFTDNIGTLGNRLPLYKASVFYLLTSRYCFLFGVTPVRAVEVLRGICGVRDVYQYSHLHNWFFQTGVSFGVPMMLATMVFSGSLLVRGLRIVSRRTKLFSGAWMVPLLTLCVIASDLLEAELNSGQHCICVVCYLFAGWTVMLDEAVSSANERRLAWRRAGILAAEFAVLAAVAAWVVPWLVTLFHADDACVIFRKPLLLLLAVLFGLVLVGAFLYELERILEARLQQQKPQKRQLILAGVLALCFAGGVFAANHSVNRLVVQKTESLEQERIAVEAVQNGTGCRLFVDDVPELYRRTFGGIGRTVFRGEMLACMRNVALITDADKDCDALMNRGFLFSEISENRAVYTNSPEAAEALENAGYHLTGYYSRERTLNHETARPLTLYNAPYRVTYELRLLPDTVDSAIKPDTVVAALTVTAEAGKRTLGSREVLFSEFHEDGTCSAVLDLSIPDAKGVEFHAGGQADTGTLILENVRYRKNPNYDVHAAYNARGRKTCEFYFSLEGTPISVYDGTHGKVFEYNAAGSVTKICCLDMDGNPVVNNAGYAEVRRVFDDNQQLIREEYFDVSGIPVNSNRGYQSFKNEYNSEGILVTTYYYDNAGNRVAGGRDLFHEYLKTLAEKTGAVIFLSVKDEGTQSLTEPLYADLKALGIRTDLHGKFRYSFYAVVRKEGVVEDFSADRPVSVTGTADGLEYTVVSAGYTAGNFSSVVVNGTEYSKNVRGINIVVVENGAVTDSVAFDTHLPEVPVTR